MDYLQKRRIKKVAIAILCLILSLVIAAISSFFILRYFGKRQFHKSDKNINASGGYDVVVNKNAVEYNGREFVLNKDVVSVLIIGIDKNSIKDNKSSGNNGQADCLFVAAVNTKTKQIKIIPINREAMTDVDVYTVNGSFAETRKEQICLAYAYGNTTEKSCENVKHSVSRYLMGINISSYVTIDLSGVSKFTNLVGGVRVEALETLKLPSGKTVKQGESILLKGDDAKYYTQYRTEDLEGSVYRLARQKQFLSSFASTAGNQIVDNFSKLGDYYNAMMPYTSTDMTFAQITYLASSCLTKNIGGAIEYKSIDGELALGEEWGEFTPNEDSLVATVLDAFYKEK